MPAFVDVSAALKNPGQAYAFAAQPELEEMEVLGDPVRFEDVTAEGEIIGVEDRVNARGAVRARVSSRCAKCLSPVTIELQAKLDAVYARQLDPDDPDIYRFEGSKIDLTDAARDALLLELPYRFLCKEDCKGLCPRCGADLNLGVCTCQEGLEVTNPFSALKAIVQNDEEV